LRLGRLNASAQAFEHAVVINSQEPVAWCRLGHVRLAAGEYAEAIQALDRALDMNKLNEKEAQVVRRDMGEALLEYGRVVAMIGTILFLMLGLRHI